MIIPSAVCSLIRVTPVRASSTLFGSLIRTLLPFIVTVRFESAFVPVVTCNIPLTTSAWIVGNTATVALTGVRQIASHRLASHAAICRDHNTS